MLTLSNVTVEFPVALIVDEAAGAADPYTDFLLSAPLLLPRLIAKNAPLLTVTALLLLILPPLICRMPPATVVAPV